MDVVVVESPAKAKTINKYLGARYKVIASYGHVRDLPAKDGSVRPEADFAMDWEVDPKAHKHLKAIAEALRGADHLYLATDPDREGEAISWHVAEVLRKKEGLRGIDVKRVVFNEITRDAVLEAFSHPRDLNRELVDAYLARRALDYLVGFTLSPVLWRKLPGSRSAGRVQSVALRLICERETEIESFRSQEYWSVEALFRTAGGERFKATLTRLEGRKLDKMAIANQAAAEAAVAAIEARTFAVDQVERKRTRRHPPPPFITSTLQQEAFRKLGFGATRTMRVAQQLYEGVTLDGETVGLITYMRTDGVQMAGEAVTACRQLISDEYGRDYLPEKPRLYKSKAKNAQEAHEAIRPTDVRRRPADLARALDADQLKLYTLIWRRTLACQMESAVLDQVAADITSPDAQVSLRATGSTLAFPGFLALYREDRDDPDPDAEGEDGERALPPLAAGDAVERERTDARQHFTQPPPRYTEASLVKRLEELGIGRPSTYATILSVLQDRKYVRIDSRRFVPEDRGRLVTAFLTSFFERYFAYSFTAQLEAKLDDISGGRIDWKAVLSEFWQDFSSAVDGTKGLRVKEVLDALDRLLGDHFFPAGPEGADARACPGCEGGRLSLKLGKFGAFIGCSNYPDCRYTRPLVPAANGDKGSTSSAAEADRRLGIDPQSGLSVVLRKGPYGYYVQLGDSGNGVAKPKRASLLPAMDPETLELDTALQLLALPRTVGIHPGTGEPISAGIGRFGPYLKMLATYVSLKADDDVLNIGLNRATELIDKALSRTKPGRTIGPHPDDGKPVVLRSGRFGPYLQHGSVRATLPRATAAETVDLEQAVALLAAKEASQPASKKPVKKGRATKAAAAEPMAEASVGAGSKSGPRPGPKSAPKSPRKPARTAKPRAKRSAAP
jgi:DNA topoisomerase-1